jgi:large subunit ribosomal protein L24
MKSKFSKSWKFSRQPRKQKKFLANAPNHIRKKLMGCNLDKKLREKYGIRNIEICKGDEVKIMRGKFKGKHGKTGVIDIKNCRIQIDGVQRTKKGGEKIETWFHPSNVKIIVLNDSDNKRMKRTKKVREEENIDKSKEKKDAHKKD